MARFGDFDQYLDNAGDPLAEGKLYFYESGTTTPKTTYSDVNNSIPNTNPVYLLRLAVSLTSSLTVCLRSYY